MRVKLIFPPNARVERPYLSLPALTAFLRERGIAVSQEDLNLAGFEFVMRPAYLSRCAEALEELLAAYRGDRARILTEYGRYRSINLALLAAPVVIRTIEEAVRFFRTADGFVDDEAYAANERILGEAANLVSAAHDPDPTGLSGFTMACSPESSDDIFRAVLDEARNPYLPLLEAYVRDTLTREAPDLVGISLAAHSQVVPGLALARLIREHLPGTRSVVGGNIPTILAGKIGRVPRLFELFDYAVLGEGETPLLRLCQHLVGDCPIGDVPNLLYLDGDEVKQSPARSSEDVNELPTPDYDGLPLSRYLSPVPVLSLQPARGCYWRKCAFCNERAIHQNAFRVRRPDKTAADMASLQARHGTGLFDIVSEGVPAKHLSALAEAIQQRGLDVSWSTSARLEAAFTPERLAVMGRSGCRKLLFGLESGSPRVLDVMGKGIRLADVPGILKGCQAASVDVHLFVMLGFPTESLEEAQQTRDFLLGSLDAMDDDGFGVSVAVFRAMADTPILEQLPALGYRLVSKGTKCDLEFVYDHEAVGAGAPRISREEHERLADELTASLSRRAPRHRALQDTGHAMCVRWLRSQEPAPVRAGPTGADAPAPGRFPASLRLRLSPWVTIRRLATIENGAESRARLVTQFVASNLRDGSLHGLNHAAVTLLQSLREPRTVGELTRRRRLRAAAARQLRKSLVDLQRRGLLVSTAPLPLVSLPTIV
jgi:radical SAM superfamily enzyme YgiQ (UPF0313 family)